MWLIILSWIASIGSIIANIFVANKKIIGAKIWTFATFILFCLALYKREWSQVFLFGVYDIINIYTWIKWNKDKN
jgi:hypothetical protein